MHLLRLPLVVVAVCGLFLNPALHAQASIPTPGAPAPWTPDKQFSTDEVITMKDGQSVTAKSCTDNGKIRMEMSVSGMSLVTILRPDEKKMFTVMPAQKMVVEMALDPAKLTQYKALSSNADAKFDLVGPDVVNGTACVKYKMTSENKTYYWWVNPITKAPVKFMPEDGATSIAFTNYKAGAQDASLFEPPAGFQVMEMPAGMGMPGGAGVPPGQ
jgi:hypothetical protein